MINKTETKIPEKEIHPGCLRGRIGAPPSKSITHRLYILAALSGKECLVRRPLESEDCNITLNALNEMGYEFYRTDNGVRFTGQKKTPGEPVTVWVGNSGTSARLLISLALLQDVPFTMDGTPRMRKRPMKSLFEALEQLGADVQSSNGFLPATVKFVKIRNTVVEVDASQSSQFLSSLLLIAPFLKEGLTVRHQRKIASRSYVDLTLALLRRAGIQVTEANGAIEVKPGIIRNSENWTVEGDYSSASYFLAGGALPEGKVFLENLIPDSVQGDRVIVGILQKMGAAVEWKENGIAIEFQSLKGIDVDMNTCPDLVPTVAVCALFADGETRIRNVAHLRFKESDRIEAIMLNIKQLGGKVFLEGEDLRIQPAPLKGALIRTFDDHRIAMSFAMVGLQVNGVKIENPGCVNKSYPEFWQQFEQLFHHQKNGSESQKNEF